MTNEIKNVPELRFPEFKEEWSKLKLGELAEIVRGSSPRPISDPRWFDINSDIGWLRISDVTEQNGKITKLEQKISKDGQKKTRVLHSKHLLLSIAATVGKPVINYVKTGVHDGFLIFLRPLFDIEFMYQWLDAYRPKWKKYGQPGSQVNLNSELVKSQKIYMPHSVEQKKISDFFSKLDRQIELEEQKLEKLEEQKKGYMQKIFSQELRFKDENGEYYSKWEKDYLGNRIKQYFEKTKINNEYPVLTSSREGIFLQKDYFTRDVASKDNTGYNVVPYGYFTYRHMSDDLVFKFNINTIVKKGIVSTLYPVFKTKDNLNSLFLKEYLNHGTEFKRYALLQKQGGSRTYMYFNKLIKLELKFPILNEQNKISNFLNEFDELVEKQNLKVKRLKERKKGFLQKMFV